MGFVAIVSVGLGICGVLLIGCGFRPRDSAVRWGSAFHAAEHFDHLYSEDWFDQLLAVVRQEQQGRAGGVFVLAGLVLQQLSGLEPGRMIIPVGLGAAGGLGILLALVVRTIVVRLCTACVGREVELLAMKDIRSRHYTATQIQNALGHWFRDRIGREACLGAGTEMTEAG